MDAPSRKQTSVSSTAMQSDDGMAEPTISDAGLPQGSLEAGELDEDELLRAIAHAPVPSGFSVSDSGRESGLFTSGVSDAREQADQLLRVLAHAPARRPPPEVARGARWGA